MSILIALLLINAILNGAVVACFGRRDHNELFLIFALVYAALALLAFLSIPYSLWIVLVVSLVGFVGLVVTFHKLKRDKSMDKAIWALDLVIIVYAIDLLSSQRLLIGGR